MKKQLFGLLLASCSVWACAKDLGVQGQVWNITERDMRELMMESAAGVDWDKVQKDTKENAEQYLDRLPKRVLATAPRDGLRWIDPSIVVPQDIQAPVKQPNGQLVWQVIVRKGQKVNPLQHVRPVTALFFYDGADNAQFELVLALSRSVPDYFMFIESGRGQIKEASESLGRPVFHANDALLSRFEVSSLPSMVYPGSGAQAGLLGVATFAAPYREQAVRLLWPSFNSPGVGTGTVAPSRAPGAPANSRVPTAKP